MARSASAWITAIDSGAHPEWFDLTWRRRDGKPIGRPAFRARRARHVRRRALVRGHRRERDGTAASRGGRAAGGTHVEPRSHARRRGARAEQPTRGDLGIRADPAEDESPEGGSQRHRDSAPRGEARREDREGPADVRAPAGVDRSDIASISTASCATSPTRSVMRWKRTACSASWC